MSIVTLKKKSGYKYNNSSVGHNQFSLNGGHRSQGFVGQTMLSRSILKTSMRGNIAIGSGGSNGKYMQAQLFPSDIHSLNDPDVIKKSTLSTNGMIKTKYRWIQRPMPFISLSNKVYVSCSKDIVKDKIIDSCPIKRTVNSELTCAAATGTTSIGTKRLSLVKSISNFSSLKNRSVCKVIELV